MTSTLKDANFEPRVILKGDGAIANGRFERLAIMLAEGIPENEAWRAAGGETKESRKYGKRVYANKTFIARVKKLTDEKQELELDPIWGEAMWQVNQLWRQAVACQDIKTMSEAVKMRVQIADKMSAMLQAQNPPAPTEAQRRGPGAPTAESQNTRRLGISEIKDALMTKYREADPDADDEADEAPVH